jgi:NAD-dependent deacetylase sirtuin 4
MVSLRSSPSLHNLQRPADPSLLATDEIYLQEQVDRLLEWWTTKEQVLALTGAGLSTESGIPDYRGHRGSYHRPGPQHRPMMHQTFMGSEYQRKRYWGRSLVGWSSFNEAMPNPGHFALARLEEHGLLGVSFANQPKFSFDDSDYDGNDKSSIISAATAHRELALVTQNVDSLHRKAGSRRVVELHGRGNVIKCMTCGTTRDRRDYHNLLETLNNAWLEEARTQSQLEEREGTKLRPDGDAQVEIDFEELIIPPCDHCHVGFYKPDVVFFGDSVPISRVAQVTAAVEACDGLLVVGSSLAVHSALRHVRTACQQGTPVAILNVGETRAETEGLLGVLKLDAPAGETLARVAGKLLPET